MRPIVLGSTDPKNILPDAFQIGCVSSNFRRLAVEFERVLEHKPNVCIQILEGRIPLLLNLVFDSGEIASVLFINNVPILRDVEGDGIDRPVEYSCPSIGVSMIPIILASNNLPIRVLQPSQGLQSCCFCGAVHRHWA